MKRLTRLACLCALLLAVALGCAPRAPMTDSEFLGFCHSAGGRGGASDSVGLCNAYLHAVGRPIKSYAECQQGCADVKRTLGVNRDAQCAATVGAANAWCERYCRTLYPE